MSTAAEKLRVAAAAAKLKASAQSNSDNASSGSFSDTDQLNTSQQHSQNNTINPGSVSSPPRQSKPVNKLRTAALALKLTSTTTQWGEYDHLIKVDIASLSTEKLKRHLKARNELAEGTKTELLERLKQSIEEERQRKIAIELELEAKLRKIADQEEKGAVYSTGKNTVGQLGLGDTQERHVFTVIPSTRGKQFHVSAGGNITIATSAQHEVFVWGGGGHGPTSLNSNQKSMFNRPQLIEKLNGEEIVMASAGANHACAQSLGGDLYVWGHVADNSLTQQARYDDAITATSIECGEMHTCAITEEKEVFTWGLSANGRLGCGKLDVAYQPTPLQVTLPTSEPVQLIACGSEHTLLTTESHVYSFGCGDGGRLGHGSDYSDKYEPYEVKPLRGAHVLSISAGTWHSACVVHTAPLDDSGLLYTWGSGFQGQLGLGTTCKAATPTLVQNFIDEGLSIKKIICGSHHNAAITHDGNLYTWGLGQNGALGRCIDQPFTPHPGLVSEFGTIVNRIGRGMARSVACGRDYTIVATYPYDGPTEAESLKLAEEHRQREEEESKRLQALLEAEDAETKRRQEEDAEKKKIQYLTSKRLCTMDPTCPGFAYEPNQPSICRECGFSVQFHTKIVQDEEET